MTVAAPYAGARPKPGAVPGVPLSLAERVRTAPTPARLRAFLGAIWVSAALLFLVGEGTLSGAREAMKTVGQDSAPSIIAAQELSSALADLDANAGNYLLGSKTHQIAAMQQFEKKRDEISKSLVAAAKNITYEAERPHIEAMVENMGRYLEMIGEIRYRKDSGDGPGAELAYGAATDLMHQRLLPAAEALDKVNYDELKKQYDDQQNRSAGAETIAGIVAAGLLAVLLWAQIFLLRKFRRLLNVPLVGASLCTVIFAVYLVTRIAAAREDLRLAKNDAFESIHALWQARSIAYDANGDETRYLLGGMRSTSFETAYNDKVAKLISDTQISAGTLATLGLPQSYRGKFADELRNVTFPGERDAAIVMVRTFAEYDKIDKRIRALDKGGERAKAIDLCIGLGADQSNAAFDRFDKALHDVLSINLKYFHSTIEDGQAGLRRAATLVPLASILIALLAFLGIRPRLAEYRA